MVRITDVAMSLISCTLLPGLFLVARGPESPRVVEERSSCTLGTNQM